MSRATVKIRGIDVEIQYRDHGYEPDTNAHDVDWWYVEPPAEGEPDLTAEEEDAVTVQLYEIIAERRDERFPDDVI